jgi:hypothetical protein
MVELGSNFYTKLVQIASELGMKPEDMVNIMVSESGLNPAAHNKNGDASGLIQFMPSTLKGMKFNGTSEDLRNMSGEEQLPLVKQYIQSQAKIYGKPLDSPALFYVATFWPVGLTLPGVRSKDPSTPIVEENPETFTENGTAYSSKYGKMHIRASQEIAAYKANPLFHGSVPGAITFGDMLRQVEKNKGSKAYANAMQELTKAGATPSASTHEVENVDAHSENDLGGILENLINTELKTYASFKKKYLKHLQAHNILLKVESYDYESELEFARILCTALDEELLSDSFIHTDGTNVEIQCDICGPKDLCFDSVKQLTESIVDAFGDATKKIGSISVKTKYFMNKKSSYQEINWKNADMAYRKFLLKFI